MSILEIPSIINENVWNALLHSVIVSGIVLG